MAGAAQSPAEAGGKFWSEATDSESEVEDLGVVNPLPGQEQATKFNPPEVHVVEADWQTVKKKARRRKEDLQCPSGFTWPWRKAKQRPWRGPLPKARISPRKTVGDAILPALEQRSAGSSSPEARRSRDLSDPNSAPIIQNLNRSRSSGPSGPRPGPSFVARQLVTVQKPAAVVPVSNQTRSRSSNPHPRSRRPSYLQAAMAGGGVKGAVGGAGGDGGGDKRRNYGNQGFRGNRFRAGQGNGRSSSPPGRDGDPAGRGGRGLDAGGRGGHAPNNWRGRGRGNRDGNLGTNNGRGGGAERDARPRSDDHDGRMEEEHGNEKRGEDHVMEEADNLGHGTDDITNPGQLNTTVPGPSGTKPTGEETRIINKAIDIAVEELLVECANKVMAEEADFLGKGMAVFAGDDLAPVPMPEVASDLTGDGRVGQETTGGRVEPQPVLAVQEVPIPADLVVTTGLAVGRAVLADRSTGGEVAPLAMAETEVPPLSPTVADAGVLAHLVDPEGMGVGVVVAESEVGHATTAYASPTKSADVACTVSSPGCKGSRYGLPAARGDDPVYFTTPGVVPSS
ncbi:hypothetical protein EJB05_00131, partial [Eragrostis curvula]